MPPTAHGTLKSESTLNAKPGPPEMSQLNQCSVFNRRD